jgi:hypothetical protein
LESHKGKTFNVKESGLLGPNYIIQRTYNNSSREHHQRRPAKEKRKCQAESGKKEKELAAELARERRKADKTRQKQKL